MLSWNLGAWTLLAQSAPPPVESGNSLMWAGFVVFLVLSAMAIAIPSIVMGIRLASRDRELEHLERMRALETGLLLPKDEPWWTPAKVAVVIGGVVPMVVVLAPLSASVTAGRIGPEVWTAVGFIGVAAVAGGTILGLRLPDARRQAAASRLAGLGKPAVEEDHFDVVGSRG